MRGAAAMAAALLLAGCGGAEEEAAPGALILDAQGVVFRQSETEFDRYPFGSPREAVERAAMQVYGEGAAKRSRNDECGAGPMEFTRFGPIQLNFQDDRLAGWLMSQGAMAARGSGIVPGITRAQLDRERGVRLIEGSTLPGEFEYATRAGRIGGFLRGSGEEAVVESLYAGANCFFR